MIKITIVQPKDDYKLFVEFEDGVSGEIDMTDMMRGPVFGPLKDPSFFELVHIDSLGVPTWFNGADIAPDAIYKELKEQ